MLNYAGGGNVQGMIVLEGDAGFEELIVETRCDECRYRVGFDYGNKELYARVFVSRPSFGIPRPKPWEYQNIASLIGNEKLWT